MICQAVRERKNLTKDIVRAVHTDIHKAAEITIDLQGTEAELDLWFSILRGIVNEYRDGGDQMVENCSCGQHEGWE
jgi:hypothetical protein